MKCTTAPFLHATLTLLFAESKEIEEIFSDDLAWQCKRIAGFNQGFNQCAFLFGVELIHSYRTAPTTYSHLDPDEILVIDG
jgi:hypothetical protein